MDLNFVDRDEAREQLFKLLEQETFFPRIGLVDSPAGMGKTYLLLDTCRKLIPDPDQAEWKFVWLDFRTNYPEQWSDQKNILMEIAHQLCEDIHLRNLQILLTQTQEKDLLLIQRALENARRILAVLEGQAAGFTSLTIPPHLQVELEDKRKEVAQLESDLKSTFQLPDYIQPDQLPQNSTLYDANIKPLRDEQKPDIISLAGFILEKRKSQFCVLPDRVLVVLDGIDAIKDDSLRKWIVNELAIGLGTHDGLRGAFKRLAVVVSGRFIRKDKDPKLSLHIEEIPLHSFLNKEYYDEKSRIEYIKTLIKQFDDSHFNAKGDLVSRLARKLAQICGGHPKVIKEIARNLFDRRGNFNALQHDPQQPRYWYNDPGFQKILRTCRNGAIEEMLEGVSSQQKLLLELLSIYRKFNSATLEFLFSQIQEHSKSNRQLNRYADCLPDDTDRVSPYENLKETKLIDEFLASFDSDRFALSLIPARMENEQHDLFCLLHKWAADWFRDRVTDPYPGEYQQTCVVEWLFHRLHWVDRCASTLDAMKTGQEIVKELEEVIDCVKPFPNESIDRRRQKILTYIKRDEQIDHLIWEIALEKSDVHDIIQNLIWDTF